MPGEQNTDNKQTQVLKSFSSLDYYHTRLHTQNLSTEYRPGMGIKNGKVSWKVGAWGPQKAPNGGPGGNVPGGGEGAKRPEAEAF